VSAGEIAATVLPAAENLQILRQSRATSKAAAGTLDMLVPMRVGGSGPAVFCAPPVVGLSWCYFAMLRYIDATYPLYGLQCRGLRRPEPLPATMTEMARDFADQIRMRQPSGPYHLLGWSLGGNIAFAIAEELQRRGHEIGLLVSLDATMGDNDAMNRDLSEPWMVYNLVLAQFGYVPALTADDPEPEVRMVELVRRRPGLGLDEWPDRRLLALQRVIRNNVAVARGYRPGRVRCPLLFFSAIRNPPGLTQKLESLRPFIDGPIEAVEVDSHHRYMLLPKPMTQLGPALSKRLARAAVTATTSPLSNQVVPN
jgi:thioesterase domain-containing protein